MDTQLVASLSSLFESCFDYDTDYEFKSYNEMNLIQLVIYKKHLIELNDDNELTKQQKEIFNGKFKEDVWNEYPATLTNATEVEAKNDKKMRDLEFKKYKAECIKINSSLFINSKETILKIEELEVQLREQSEAKYKAEQKIYANSKCICECGMETIRKNKSTHKKSKFHQVYEANVAKVAAEKQARIENKKKQNLINSRMNNGYQINDVGNIIWPVDQEGNRFYLTDPNGNNIYPKSKEGYDFGMKCANGFTIPFPRTTKCYGCSICK